MKALEGTQNVALQKGDHGAVLSSDFLSLFPCRPPRNLDSRTFITIGDKVRADAVSFCFFQFERPDLKKKKIAARNSHCCSFISSSCYGLSWGCRRLFVSELKIRGGASGQPCALLLPSQAEQLAPWAPSGPLGARL